MSNYILITGAGGEFGHGLITTLQKQRKTNIIALDLNPLPKELADNCVETYYGNILDSELIAQIFSKYSFSEIYHLAALLSTSAEKMPEKAYDVNVNGTLQLLSKANQQAIQNNTITKFIFCSTIAVYGLPDLKTKAENIKVKEEQFLQPITMYGVNKLACEQLGIYYTKHYKQLDPEKKASNIDFRCIRFPGVISAFTIPTGGTSDYAPEMIHAAAKSQAYKCFVREDVTIPFITMPEAINALINLAEADKKKLTSTFYNISGFSVSAKQIFELVKKAFPDATISFEPHLARQTICDSWPMDVDDSKAKADWNYKPTYTIEQAFSDYLIPNIATLYSKK